MAGFGLGVVIFFATLGLLTGFWGTFAGWEVLVIVLVVLGLRRALWWVLKIWDEEGEE